VQDLVPDRGVLLHRPESAGLVQDGVADPDLADVVLLAASRSRSLCRSSMPARAAWMAQ
jgi:hypothetical protein